MDFYVKEVCQRLIGDVMYSVEMKYILTLNIRPYLSEGLLSNAKLAIFQLYQS
jgi:hypothetical protein